MQYEPYRESLLSIPQRRKTSISHIARVAKRKVLRRLLVEYWLILVRCGESKLDKSETIIKLYATLSPNSVTEHSLSESKPWNTFLKS